MPEFIPSFTPTETPDGVSLDEFTRGYLECAEFTDCSADDELTADAVGFAPVFIQQAWADCADFQQANADDLAQYYELTGYDESYAGHDFWLTRNGHGAGFWDRGSDPVLKRLTQAAHVYGTVDLYAGDDNLIYGD